MKIRFGTFAKETNSTKQPTGSWYEEKECQLKDDVSLHQPVLLIHRDDYNILWNYAYIVEWSRYYFISDAIITTGGIWELALTEDVLATWKTEIGNSSCYVSRSASDGSDFLPDSTWSHDTSIATSYQSIDLSLNSTGVYLLFTASDENDSSGVAGCSCYVLTATQLANLIEFLFSSAFFDIATSDITDTATSALAKTFFNPFQYVLRCMWIPFNLTDIPHASASNIHFGWWEANDPNNGVAYTGYLVQTDRVYKIRAFTCGSYSLWIDRDPSWSKYDLYLPGAGTISIPSDYAGQTLTLEMDFDLATGAVGYVMTNATNTIIASASGQLGADIQLSALYKDFVSQGASGLIGTVSKGFMAGVRGYIHGVQNMDTSDKSLRGALNAMGNVVEETVKGVQAGMQPTASSIGSNGIKAIIKAWYNARLSITKYTRYSDNYVQLGKMCNSIKTLNTLSGYTECVNPKVDISGTAQESSAIQAFLTTGFYME